MKRLTVLGSTGSVGVQTLEVAKHLGYKIISLSTNSNIKLLEKQIREFKPEKVAVMNAEKAKKLKKKLNIKVCVGLDGLVEIATMPKTDIVVVAVVGSAGLIPTIEAIMHKKDIALANKETLVAGGELVMQKVKEYNVNLVPIDSEHSAILQCLNGEEKNGVNKIILTCSGGPLQNYSKKSLKKVTIEQALNHPTWSMGNKISIDSATLMNKGFEVLEAKHMFGLELSQIEIVIHPQSIVHSMVEYVDGSVIAQLGIRDMKIPIQYALTYPKRLKNELPKLNLAEIGKLTFYKPDVNKFPCLKYAYESAKIGGTMPAVMNAANEVAVYKFLNKKISFTDIPKKIKEVMKAHKVIKNPNLNKILEADEWARQYSKKT